MTGVLIAAGLFFLILFFLLAPRKSARPTGGLLNVVRTPVSRDIQQLFSPYGGGDVTGIIQLREGLQVGYSSGALLTFVPVPDRTGRRR